MIRVCQHKPVKGMNTVEITQECWGIVDFLAESYSLWCYQAGCKGQDCRNDSVRSSWEQVLLKLKEEVEGGNQGPVNHKLPDATRPVVVLPSLWSPLPKLFCSVYYSQNAGHRWEPFLCGKFPYKISKKWEDTDLLWNEMLAEEQRESSSSQHPLCTLVPGVAQGSGKSHSNLLRQGMALEHQWLLIPPP